jgi:LPS export ABC transporter protein LptC
VISALLAGCADTEQRPRETSGDKIPDSIIYDATIALTSEGKKEAVIFADTLKVFDREDSTAAKGVKVDFYDEDGSYRSTLTSERGLVRQTSRELWVWGDVVVESDTSRLETESLHWNPARQLIVTEDFVRLYRGTDMVSGYGMEADSRLEHVRILRDVKGTITEVPRDEEELEEIEGETNEGVLP